MLHQTFSSAFTTMLVVFAATTMLTNAATAADKENVIHTFAYGKRGAQPLAALISDSAGNLYGTTDDGGSYNLGTVFELTPKPGSGWTEEVLHVFAGKDGANPYASLVFDSRGNLYGTTLVGGSAGFGTVFELTPRSRGSWDENVLYNFKGGTDGAFPTASLILDSAGDLYGTTSWGGGTDCDGGGCGTVFELTPNANGWTESVLYSFTNGADGWYPYSSLIFDASGNLYGTASEGGGAGYGTVFELTSNASGWIESVLYSFTGPGDGGYPFANLIFDSVGNLYGTTGIGTVFELKPKAIGGWTEAVLYTFSGTKSQNYILAGLVFDISGNLYGTTYLGGALKSCRDCGAVFRLAPGASGHWTETALHNFTGKDGEHPYASLIFDKVGNLYGSTGFSGPGGNGTVFELKPDSRGWRESVICGFNGVDGEYSHAGLIIDAAGNLYGTTDEGGSVGFGSVFELTPKSGGSWNETVLYSFKGYKDGAYPLASLVLDSAGNLYGTSAGGGVKSYGTIFELSHTTRGWTETVLHSFALYGEPSAGLIFDAAGNLYGTTAGGNGTVFELTRAKGRWAETVLHTFCKICGDGWSPSGGLVFDAAGNLYGTTRNGGAGSAGTVFELTPAANGKWVETVLCSFSGGKDGDAPLARLVFDAAGNLYGTTEEGGTFSVGTVFSLSPNGKGGWTENILYSFTGGADGAYPFAGLAFDVGGNLYGTTSSGPGNGCGGDGCGAVFELMPSNGEWLEKTLISFTGGADGGLSLAGLIFDASGNLYGTTSFGGKGAPGAGVVFEFTP